MAQHRPVARWEREFSRNSMRDAETARPDPPRVRLANGRYDADGVMRRTRVLLFVPLLAAAVLLARVALAREISMQEAVAQAQREVDGKVLSVQTLNVGKRKIYRIKVLTHDGRVRVVQVPAEK